MNIDELLDRLDAAVSGRPRGGDTIRTIALHLESEADTPERKEVVRSLKNPGPGGDLRMIAAHVRSVFIRGTIGVDGWPRK